MPAALMKHATDPAQDAINSVGDLSKVNLHFEQVMVVTYIRPKVTAGGILLTDETVSEDRFQGKCGIVVKKGPLAFVPSADDPRRFDEVDVNVGDYVVYRPSDGWPIKINGKECRIISDTAIKMKIDRPDRVW